MQNVWIYLSNKTINNHGGLMKIYIRGGSAGEMFMSECKECSTILTWNKLVVSDYGNNTIIRRCIPCYDDKFGKIK